MGVETLIFRLAGVLRRQRRQCVQNRQGPLCRLGNPSSRRHCLGCFARDMRASPVQSEREQHARRRCTIGAHLDAPVVEIADAHDLQRRALLHPRNETLHPWNLKAVCPVFVRLRPRAWWFVRNRRAAVVWPFSFPAGLDAAGRIAKRQIERSGCGRAVADPEFDADGIARREHSDSRELDPAAFAHLRHPIRPECAGAEFQRQRSPVLRDRPFEQGFRRHLSPESRQHRQLLQARLGRIFPRQHYVGAQVAPAGLCHCVWHEVIEVEALQSGGGRAGTGTGVFRHGFAARYRDGGRRKTDRFAAAPGPRRLVHGNPLPCSARYGWRLTTYACLASSESAIVPSVARIVRASVGFLPTAFTFTLAPFQRGGSCHCCVPGSTL